MIASFASMALTVFLAAASPAPVVEIECPAGPGSGQPNLFVASDGTTYLSWIEPRDEGHVFLFSTLSSAGWSEPRAIAAGQDWFVNWADVPSLIVLNDGTLVAHWLAKSGPDTYAYDVRMSFSHDGGATWSASIVPHRDGTQTEHGFVTMMPWQQDELVAVWLDGRKYANHEEAGVRVAATKEMTLRAARFSRTGDPLEEHLLDARVCDCCPTTAALTPGGLVVAYRDRSEREIRDMGVVRLTPAGWTDPITANPDGWEVPGCPVNGPALVAHGDDVALAWFTAAGGEGRVKVAFSADGGRTFGEGIVVDDGDPVGRVDAVTLDGRVLVSWMEVDGKQTQIRVRAVAADGRRGPSFAVAATRPSRGSGIPRMAFDGEGLVFAWVMDGEPASVRTARLRPSGVLEVESP